MIKTSYLLLWLFSLSIILTACRKEEMELIETPNDDTLNPSSSVASVMKKVAMKDGSSDNIIDRANCLTVELPVTVIANGITLTINTTSDYNAIEAIFDDSFIDVDTLDIIFPINIILNDHTTVTVNNTTELSAYAASCNGENEFDDDIECIDFQYPLNIAVFNINNELIYTDSLTNDYDMHTFLASLSTDIIAQFEFPVALVLANNTVITANTFSEIETNILNHIDDCDEDDDYDYNDDDCPDCTPIYVTDILTGCSDWVVEKLERNGNDYDDLYTGYTFNFYTNNTISAYYSGNTVYGTWTADENNGVTTLTIDIPSLPYCNNNWTLHEVSAPPGETKVDLRVGDDRIRYENFCN
ncbi:MAG: hypothetical protein GYB39_06075 [Algicola sp.]|nr:hypothetical protein [Algicola sp.]